MGRCMRSVRDEGHGGLCDSVSPCLCVRSSEDAAHTETQRHRDTETALLSVFRHSLCCHQFNCVDASGVGVYLRLHDAGRKRNETDVSHPDVLLRDALDGAPAAGGMRVGSSANDR
jgi:hypothetical protein